MQFKIPAEKGSISSKRLENVVEFGRSRETQQREPKRHATTNTFTKFPMITLDAIENTSTVQLRRFNDAVTLIKHGT